MHSLYEPFLYESVVIVNFGNNELIIPMDHGDFFKHLKDYLYHKQYFR